MVIIRNLLQPLIMRSTSCYSELMYLQLRPHFGCDTDYSHDSLNLGTTTGPFELRIEGSMRPRTTAL
jgi:hypothetical protein